MGTVELAELPNEQRIPQPGRYRHFKGNEYELLSVARHTETAELLVVYRAVDDPSCIWVRPLPMFLDLVDSPAGPHPRFQPAPDVGLRHSPLRALAHLWRPLRRLGPPHLR
jgi:hypothetical protein